VCVFYPVPSEGSSLCSMVFYFKIEKRDILVFLNTTLLVKITAKNNGGLNINTTFNYLETMQMKSTTRIKLYNIFDEYIVQFVVTIRVVCCATRTAMQLIYDDPVWYIPIPARRAHSLP